MTRRVLPAPTSGRLVLSLLALLAGLCAPGVASATAPTIQHFTATVTAPNLITLDWLVSGGNSTNLLYIYDGVGFRAQSCRSAPQPPGCSTTVRAKGPGVVRYTLSVRNENMEFAKQTIDVTVPDFPPPTSATGRVDIDLLNVTPQSISWSYASSTGFVRIFDGNVFPIVSNLPTTGSYPIPVSALTPGRHDYSIQYCETPVPNADPFCGGVAPVVFDVHPGRFSGDYRQFVPSGQGLTLSWTGLGNSWFLEAPTLGIATWVYQPTYTVPASSLAVGVHTFKLTSCVYGGVGCSNRADIFANQAGVVSFSAASYAAVQAGAQVGTLTPVAGSTVALKAARSGTFVRLVANGSSVASGSDVATVVTEDKDFKQVVVGSGSTATWTTRAWSTDFSATLWDTTARTGALGIALDASFDSQGGLWQLGEYSTAIAHVDQNGVLLQHDVPLDRVGSLYEKVKPFGSTLFGVNNNVPYTELGERVIDDGSAVWFTQGGGLFYPETGNYSRIVRYDPNGTDPANSPDDGRLCAIHVPGNDSEVVGIAYDGSRIWFAESGAGILGWFDAATMPCDNSLDYSTPATVDAADAAIRCTTPSQLRCIHEIAVPAAMGLPAHIAVDSDGTLWISDFSGGALGHYSPATGAFSTFPMPTSISTSKYRGVPWQIRVDSDAVYVDEYADNDLILFDKHGSNCTALVNGENPCMKQIHLPVKTSDVLVHSIDLAGGRLWFTLSNEAGDAVDPNATAFGYVDVASWKAGAPTGVLYTGFETLGSSSAGGRHSFHGIDVASNGQILLADMAGLIVRLTPTP